MISVASKFYDDLDTFFSARGLKRRNDGDWWEDSYDYGVWWYDERGNIYRLTWIGPVGRTVDSSGELYLVRMSGPFIGHVGNAAVMSVGGDEGSVEFVGVIPPACEDTRSSILDYNRDEPYPAKTADELLTGWGEVCGSPNSVQWVRDRMARAVANGTARKP